MHERNQFNTIPNNKYKRQKMYSIYKHAKYFFWARLSNQNTVRERTTACFVKVPTNQENYSENTN